MKSTTPTSAGDSAHTLKKTKCKKCKGRGYVVLIAGPMIMDGTAVCGGPRKYDCRICGGNGRV